jgi:hypothetical protein
MKQSVTRIRPPRQHHSKPGADRAAPDRENGSVDVDQDGRREHAKPSLTLMSAPSPRSLHRPLASTDGNLTEHLNEIGVRLWTDPSLI